ncbi:hypothetical protein TNCV_3196941 [Trichonephila clavipes]|nr:hypothetical protein TNCV_3196941 [Trichonephila clavipes]
MGSRTRGRPPTRWIEDVENDLKTLNIKNWQRVAAYRWNWRKRAVEAAKTCNSLRTESQLREAISTMQLFGGLKPTGLIDEATLELMRRRRCGVSDVIPGGPYRVKRYAIQGQKWPSTNLSWR